MIRTASVVVILGVFVSVASVKAQQLSRLVPNDDEIEAEYSPPVSGVLPASFEQPPASFQAETIQDLIKVAPSLQVTGTLTTQGLPRQQTVCGVIWQSSPPPEGPPFWLSTPRSASDLQTDVPYTYLAGKLIQSGVVVASECAGNGLQADGTANSCGMVKARAQVTVWQNQFDEAIYQAALRNQVPAQLLKRIFAQESQFWGAGDDGEHFGLGHTTEGGLDALFFWDQDIYRGVCPSVFSAETCSRSYAELSSSEKAMLRGYLLSERLDIVCPACQNGIDLNKAFSSIDIFARLVVANCQQLHLIINNVTGMASGNVSSYEDLWRYTLVNYNVGSGCLSESLTRIRRSGLSFNWRNVSDNLSRRCNIARVYVDNITQ